MELTDTQWAIDALYKPTNKVIESGHDRSLGLLERVINRYEKNYNALGGYDTPRNNVFLRAVFGYCQRLAPINFILAFAQGIYNIVEDKEKLNRSFEDRNLIRQFILPVDSNSLSRSGYEYFYGWRGQAWARSGLDGISIFQNLCQPKTTAVLQSCFMQPQEKSCAIL